MKYDLVIKEVAIINADNNKKYNIGVTNGIINFIGQEDISGNYTILGNGQVAVPGMVNTHTHAAMTLFRSYADDMVLMDWLQNKIWPAEANLNPNDIYWGTQLAIAEMLKTGTTCFADMYFAEDKVAQAVEETGIKASLSRGLTGLDDSADAKLKENVEFFKNWHNKAEGRIKVMLGPHAPYTCPVPFLKKIIAAAANIGAELHMHLSETKGEVEECVKNNGLTPIALMNELGMFDLGTLAAHCVYVNDADLDIMAKKRVRVAHNPQSNLKLASGIAPVNAMLKKDILVGLGTDGASSNNNLDMLEEARLAAMLQKTTTGDPTAVSASQALTMATVMGAKALGFTDCGEIKIGNKADLVLYDMSKPYWYPRHNLTSLFIYAANASDASTVVVDGKVLMEKGELLTIDIERVYSEANSCAKRLTMKNKE